jgi:hypothetical protein
MAFISVAVAGIGAASSLIGGSSAAGAQRDAANQNAALQREQIAENRRQYDQNRTDLAPYRSTGYSALNQLALGMGLGPSMASGSSAGTPDYTAYLANDPDVAQAYQNLSAHDKAQFPTPESYAQYHYQTYGQGEGRNLPNVGGTSGNAQTVAQGGDFTHNFAISDFVKDPGYDFRQQEGQRGVEASAAARGGILSGGALKAISRYNQDFASNEYGAAYNRYNSDLTNRFNRLSSLAGIGQTATNSGIEAGNTLQSQNQAGINNISINNSAAADAQASSYLNAGKTISNFAGNLGSYLNAGSLNRDAARTIANNKSIF